MAEAKLAFSLTRLSNAKQRPTLLKGDCCLGNGRKTLYCNDLLDFKAKEILMCKANVLKCQVHK